MASLLQAQINVDFNPAIDNISSEYEENSLVVEYAPKSAKQNVRLTFPPKNRSS